MRLEPRETRGALGLSCGAGGSADRERDGAARREPGRGPEHAQPIAARAVHVHRRRPWAVARWHHEESFDAIVARAVRDVVHRNRVVGVDDPEVVEGQRLRRVVGERALVAEPPSRSRRAPARRSEARPRRPSSPSQGSGKATAGSPSVRPRRSPGARRTRGWGPARGASRPSRSASRRFAACTPIEPDTLLGACPPRHARLSPGERLHSTTCPSHPVPSPTASRPPSGSASGTPCRRWPCLPTRRVAARLPRRSAECARRSSATATASRTRSRFAG